MPCFALLRLFAAVVVAVAALSGCGSSSKSSSAPAKDVKRGGTLTVVMNSDVDSLDPGQDYYQPGYMLTYAVNRTLYYYEPQDTGTPHPDLAAGPPVISADRKTITIKIKPNIRYAPPLHQTVVAADVKYAIERGFSANLPSPYAGLYLSIIKGAPHGPAKGVPDIPGIRAPDAHTLVLTLTKPYAATVIGALSLPISVPVPQAYAAPFDAHSPTTYNQHVAFIGPYMVAHDATGKLTGYKPGRSITIVRNPNWNPKTDDRPAYVNRIVFNEGNADVQVASRQILDGSGLINGDFSPTPAVLESALTTKKAQISITPSASFRAVSMNITLPPFNDINVRKAVSAVFDRRAMLLSRGGTTQGALAWGFIPPGIPGFDQSGGATTPKQFDFLQSPTGNMALATAYMKKAGFPSGRYTGPVHPLEVGVQGGDAQQAAEITQAELAKLGIVVKLRLTTGDAYLSKFCGVPKAKVAVCPSTSYGQDFPDAETLLVPTFSGAAIRPSFNANASQLNDPKVNAAIATAQALPPGDARAAAWAKVNLLIVAAAVAVPYQWDRYPNIQSSDVVGVVNRHNTAYDLAYTSLR